MNVSFDTNQFADDVVTEQKLHVDVAVIGGGLAGTCAAIAAAREGCKVALVQNRPILGGNSSSEIRVPVAGATGMFHNRYARETGIIGELLVENQYRNPAGNVMMWDALLLEWVRREPNITLMLNTEVRHVATTVAEGETTRISAVLGWTTASEIETKISAGLFIDCTGDGLLGALSGADFVTGREARAQTGEMWAPETADAESLGSTILFYTKDAGEPVPYVPPSFAIDLKKSALPLTRIEAASDSGAKYWWVEYGGQIDTIKDNEAIRDELWGIVYGIWDYIKNSGEFEAETLTLEWVGSVPGKRGSRRFVGDYVLNQNDVVEQKTFPDVVTFGGWPVDLHDARGAYSPHASDKHMVGDGVFDIPLRTLYSRNVENLMFAGRNISTTFAGNGATRVMATCAALGEAAGTAAALCSSMTVSPRELGRLHVRDLQQLLLKNDATLLGIVNRDPRDKARSARITASSVLSRLESGGIGETQRFDLDTDFALLLPVDPELGAVDFLMDVSEDCVLEMELWSTGAGRNYVPAERIDAASVPLGAGASQWVTAGFSWRPNEPQNVLIVLRRTPGVRLHVVDEEIFGVLAAERARDVLPKWYRPDGSNDSPPGPIAWAIRHLNRTLPVFKAQSSTDAYRAAKAVNGIPRPDQGPNIWSSARSNAPEWLEFTWSEPQSVREIFLTFNDDVNERLHNLDRYHTPFRIIPELVKSYTIEARIDGGWAKMAEVDDNRQRRRKHVFERPVQTDALRITCRETNGSQFKQVVEVRVY